MELGLLPSSSHPLKAPHLRGPLFCLLKAQPQQAHVQLQGAVGVEAETVQLGVCSLLPLPETKEAEAAQTDFFPPAQARGSGPRLPTGRGPLLVPLYLGRVQRVTERPRGPPCRQ